MASYAFFAYHPDVLSFDGTAGTYTVNPAYSPYTDRVLIEITDDDTFADGDLSADEVGEDANQIGTVTRTNGDFVASGQIYVEDFFYLSTPEGAFIMVDRFEIGGVVVGYSSAEPLIPGTTYTLDFSQDVDDDAEGGGAGDSRLQYTSYQLQTIPCFGPGALIATPRGEVPVEHLKSGDMVLTLDHGPQPIRWLQSRAIAPKLAGNRPDACPYTVRTGAISRGVPARDLTLSANHRLLLRDPRLELWFASPEVLVAVKAMADGAAICAAPVTTPIRYTHMLFDRHEIVQANGLWVESLFAGPETLRGLTGAARAGYLKASSLVGPMIAARPILRARDAIVARDLFRAARRERNRKNRVAARAHAA